MLNFIFLSLLSFSAVADEWTTADTSREVTYQVIQAVDWAQTRSIVRGQCWYINGDSRNACVGGIGRYEMNPILGTRPSLDRVDIYFVASAVVHYLISDTLPEKYRAPFQYVSIVYEAGVVNRNFHLGIGAKF